MSQPTPLPNYPQYAFHVESLVPAPLRAQALAAGIPWGTVLHLIGVYGLPLTIRFLESLLAHIAPAQPPNPQPSTP